MGEDDGLYVRDVRAILGGGHDTLEWNQPSDGAYVHLKYEGSDIVDYQFAAGPTNLGQITITEVDAAYAVGTYSGADGVKVGDRVKK